MEFTGERVIPKLLKPTNGMLLEHLARYYFATPYAKGRVLDIACGVGYGSQMVAKACKKELTQIIGVDNNEETITYAKGHHYHPLVQYVLADALDEHLIEKIGTFDTILSFETIEHVPNEQPFLMNLYKLLNPSGTLVLSTPFGSGKGQPTNEPFHYHQFTVDEFHSMFEQFSATEFYYQRGVTFEATRRNVRYPFGIAVCTK